MKLFSKAALVFAGLVISFSAAATPLSSLVGDKDCFGTGGVCTEGAWLPGGWSISATGSDPLFTDRGYSTSATTSWTHNVVAGSYATANLSFRTAGIADIFGPYTVYVDGVAVGAMPLDGFGHIIVETFSFNFNGALLADGVANVSFNSVNGDYWAIDYSEITYGGSAVPEPSSIAMLGLGLLGLVAMRRKFSA